MAKSGPQSPYGYSPGAWRMIGRGMEMGAVIGGLTYVGYLGDERFGTGPWLTLSGAALATVGGSYNLAKGMLFPARRPPEAPPGITPGITPGVTPGNVPGETPGRRDGSSPDNENH
jgi:Putative F0F1-ATPase subunit Ca2+/Mg2+ transporter